MHLKVFLLLIFYLLHFLDFIYTLWPDLALLLVFCSRVAYFSALLEFLEPVEEKFSVFLLYFGHNLCTRINIAKIFWW